MHHPGRRDVTTCMAGLKKTTTKTITFAKISPKVVNPRHITGNAVTATVEKHCQILFSVILSRISACNFFLSFILSFSFYSFFVFVGFFYVYTYLLISANKPHLCVLCNSDSTNKHPLCVFCNTGSSVSSEVPVLQTNNISACCVILVLQTSNISACCVILVLQTNTSLCVL